MKRTNLKPERLVAFRSIRMDLIGPCDLAHNREAKGAAIDLIRTIEHDTRHLIKECRKVSPVLKRFRIVYVQGST